MATQVNMSITDPRALRSTVIRLAIPAVLEMVLHTFVWMVDTAIVGRLSTEALAAVSFGSNVVYTLIFIYGAIGVGTTALVARYYGAGDREQAERAGGQAVLMSLWLGLAAFLSVRLVAPMIFSAASLVPHVKQQAVLFTDIVSLGAPLAILMHACSGVLRGTGNTKTPLVITLIMNVVSAGSEYALIYGVYPFPRLGFIGAALGPVLGWVVGASVALWALFGPNSTVRLPIGTSLKWSREQAARLIRLSGPASLENLVMDGGRTVGMILIGGLGTTAVAAHQVAVCTESFSFMPGYGFAISASIIAGQALGAGAPEYAKAATREALKIACSFMGLMGLMFVAFPQAFISVFTQDPAVIALGASCLRIVGFAQVFVATTEVFAGTLRGSGDTRASMLITMAGVWLVRIPFTYLATRQFGLGLQAVWIVMLLDWAFRSVLAYLRFRSGKWQTLEV